MLLQERKKKWWMLESVSFAGDQSTRQGIKKKVRREKKKKQTLKRGDLITVEAREGAVRGFGSLCV